MRMLREYLHEYSIIWIHLNSNLNLILECKEMRRLFQLDQVQMRVLELQHIELEL